MWEEWRRSSGSNSRLSLQPSFSGESIETDEVRAKRRVAADKDEVGLDEIDAVRPAESGDIDRHEVALSHEAHHIEECWSPFVIGDERNLQLHDFACLQSFH